MSSAQERACRPKPLRNRRESDLVIPKGVAAPAANARMFIAADGGHGHMAITGLSRLPKGRTYQVWFTIDPPTNLDDVRTVTVTEEPIPASTVPTGATLLDGRL